MKIEGFAIVIAAIVLVGCGSNVVSGPSQSTATMASPVRGITPFPNGSLASKTPSPPATSEPTGTPVATRIAWDSALVLAIPKDAGISVAWSLDGKRLFIGTHNNGVLVASPFSGDVLPGNGSAYVASLAISPNGKTLAAGLGYSDSIVLIPIEPGGIKQDMPGLQAGAIPDLSFSPDGKYLASGGDAIQIWNAASGELLKDLYDTDGILGGIAFSPDGKALVAVDGTEEHHTFHIWDTATWSIQKTFPANKTTDLAFSPDGSHLATGSDAVLDLKFAGGTDTWNIKTGTRSLQLKQNPVLPILAVAYSPDGRYLAAGGIGPNIILWDANTGKPVRELYYGPEWRVVRSLAFSPDGGKLASVGSEVLVWSIAAP